MLGWLRETGPSRPALRFTAEGKETDFLSSGYEEIAYSCHMVWGFCLKLEN